MGTNTGLLFGGIFLYSLGISATTVGRVAWARDWNREGQFDSIIVRFQIGYAAGGCSFRPCLASSLIPVTVPMCLLLHFLLTAQFS